MKRHIMNVSFRIVLLAVLSIVICIPLSTENIFSEGEIKVDITSFENSKIIKFHNYSGEKINEIRMWPSDGFSFESYKVERGWNVKKTENGVLIFSSDKGIMENESIKIGIKSSNIHELINWKAISNEGKVIKTSVIVANKQLDSTQLEPNPKESNKLEKSKIRIIPEKIRVNSNFRIIGEGFKENSNLRLFIGEQKLKSFKADNEGRFISSLNIPSLIKIERNDISIKDDTNNEKKISIRVHEPLNRLREKISSPLSIESLSNQFQIGDILRISGKSMPEKDVTITITDMKGKIETTEVITVDSKGMWFFEKEIYSDTVLGIKEIRVEDGKSKEIRQITVVSDKKIQIHPVQNKYEPGEKIIFEGIGIANQDLEINLENPKGAIIYSDVIKIDNSKRVMISYESLKSDPEGTYVLTATQGTESEIILVGLGVLPEEQLIIKMDSMNYSTTDNPKITVKGSMNSMVNLLIIDPSDKEKMSDKIMLDSSGRASYELELNGYSSGVYTAVISRGGSQDSIIFTVGLQTGSGPIHASTTKQAFKPTESILVIGETGKNTILTISLIDPNKITVKEIKTFSDKDGKFSSEKIKIPVDAITGTWKLNIKSGGNYIDLDIEVSSQSQEGLVIELNKREYKYEEIITLSGSGAKGNRVFVTIFDPNNNKIIELDTPRKGDGTFTIPWTISIGNELGVYLVKVVDGNLTNETTFNLIK